MPRKESTPNRRASEAKQDVIRVKRRYKKNVDKQKRLLPAEIPHVKNMVAVLHLAHYPNVQIARIIGIGRGQVAEFLAEPDVEKMIVKLREGIPAAALDLMEGYMIEAVQAMVDVMRSAEDDGIVLKAAAEILDRGGMPKTSKQVREQTNEDKTTFTDDGFVEALKRASPEVQEEAARIMEGLEDLLAKASAEQKGETAVTDE